MGSSKPKIKILAITCLPLMVSCLISFFLIHSVTSTHLENQSRRFGQAISDHLALSVADHLFNNDVLSLNVLLADLSKDKNFDSASVYNSSDELLAQAGRQNKDTIISTQQVTFQNVIAGYVRVGFDFKPIRGEMNQILLLSLLSHGLLILLLGGLVWFYADLIYLWVLHPQTLTKPKVRETIAPPTIEEPSTSCCTVLVIKVRPTRLLPNYLSRLEQALTLHAGEMERVGDDLMLTFDKANQIFQATCSGLLLLEMNLETPINIKIGMHQTSNGDDISEIEQTKKHASYLASLSESELLTSRQVHELVKAEETYNIEPYHSSMAPDGEVYCIKALSNHSLIESQAKQLLTI